MARTTTDLYRRGNALNPRMTHVRVGKDIVTFFQNGIEFVRAHSGGISTFSIPGPGRNWWVLPGGSEYPGEISVINDHGHHYNWEPNVDLPLADFVALLATVEAVFTRIS
jgi:hypothetical protein